GPSALSFGDGLYHRCARRRRACIPVPPRAHAAEAPSALRAQRCMKLEAAIRDDEAELARLRARITRPSNREATEREVNAAANRLALDRLRLELLTILPQGEAPLASGGGPWSAQ